MLPFFGSRPGGRKLYYNLDLPSFQRDFASLKTLDHGTGPDITFTRASGATYFDADGVLQTAANDVPRFDHDPADGSSLGLLIEEARTNSIRNSQVGGSTNGVIGSGGVAPTNWVVGDGSMTSEIIGTGTESGFNYIDIKFSGTNSSGSQVQVAVNFDAATQVVASLGQSWVGSVYAHLTAGSLSGLVNIGVELVERDSSGVYLSGTISSFLSTLTGSRQRFVSTRVFDQATVARTMHRIVGSIPNGNSVDFTLRIAAPQLEQGAFPTSYIPTTTAAATRSADSAVVTPISSFYNQSEGTLFAEVSRYQVAKGGVFAIFTDGSDANRFFALETGVAVPTQQRLQISGAALLNFAEGVAGTTYRMITVQKANDFIGAQNGTLTSADSSGTAPTTLTRLSIGMGSTDSNSGYAQLNGHIRKIAYWPKRLTNTLLEQLTT